MSKYASKSNIIKQLEKLHTILEIAIDINSDASIKEEDKKDILITRLAPTGISLHNNSTNKSDFETNMDNIADIIDRLSEFIENPINFELFGTEFNELSSVCADAVIENIYTIVLRSYGNIDYTQPVIANISHQVHKILIELCKESNPLKLELDTFKNLIGDNKYLLDYIELIKKSEIIKQKAIKEGIQNIDELNAINLLNSIIDKLIELAIISTTNIKGLLFVECDIPFHFVDLEFTDTTKMSLVKQYRLLNNLYSRFIVIMKDGNMLEKKISFINYINIKFTDGQLIKWTDIEKIILIF